MRPFIAVILAIAFACPVLAAEPLKPLPVNTNLKSVMVEGLSWSGDLATALELANKEKKLVFIDFTGITCTNCKINEKGVFSKEEVKEQFKRYVRVQLYTDVIPEGFYMKPPSLKELEKDAEANAKFQVAATQTEQLPYYVIVKPSDNGTFEIVAAYDEGKINHIDKFIDFLKKPLGSK